MTAGNPIQTSFNSGLLSRRLFGQVTLAKYPAGISEGENFIPVVQGPLVKRPGTRFVIPAKYNDREARLQRFEFSLSQSFILEFGDYYMRVMSTDGAITEAEQNIIAPPIPGNPVQMEVSEHGLVDDDHVFIRATPTPELNDRWFRVSVIDTDRFHLVGEDGAAYSTGEGGTIAKCYEVATPYAHTAVHELQFEQSNDVLTIVHTDYPPAEVSREADTNWVYAPIALDEPPFNVENSDKAIEVWADGVEGTVTVTATSAIFQPGHAGGYFQLRELYASEHAAWDAHANIEDDLNMSGVGDYAFNDGRLYELTESLPTGGGAHDTGGTTPVHDEGEASDGLATWLFVNEGYGYGLITAVAPDGLSCTMDVVERIGPTLASEPGKTYRWSFGSWSDEEGFPAAVAYYQDRLCMGGSKSFPQTVWCSAPGNYVDFKYAGVHAEALTFKLNTRNQNTIQWMAGEETLVIGTLGGEFALSPANREEALSRENFLQKPTSRYGSKRGPKPLSIDNSLIFVQRHGKKIHEYVYSDAEQRFLAPDLTDLSDEIMISGVRGVESQHEPHRLVWAWGDGGELASMTYVREQQVMAWGSHVFGGTDAKCISASVIPAASLEEDQPWFIVERTIGGESVRYVEYMEKPWDVRDELESAYYVDCGLTYSGSPTGTVSGLNHLEGEIVIALADGYPTKRYRVENGQITLPDDDVASVIHVGLQYAAKAKTMQMETGARAGTSQGKTKRATKIVFRVYQTGAGLFYGTTLEGRMHEAIFRHKNDPMDTALPLFDGDSRRLSLPTGYDKAGTIAFLHEQPLPCHVSAIMPLFHTQEGG